MPFVAHTIPYGFFIKASAFASPARTTICCSSSERAVGYHDDAQLSERSVTFVSMELSAIDFTAAVLPPCRQILHVSSIASRLERDYIRRLLNGLGTVDSAHIRHVFTPSPHFLLRPSCRQLL